MWVGPKQRQYRNPVTGATVLPGSSSSVSHWGVSQSVSEAVNHLSIAAIQDFCLDNGLAKFKLPRVIMAQGHPLPKTSSGKVKKQELQKKLNLLLQHMAGHKVSKL